MSDADVDFGKLIFGLLLLAIGLLAIGGMLATTQHNNQIVRPDPSGPSAPVVPQLPSLLSELRMMKSRCESRAGSAIDIIRSGRAGSDQLTNGARFYGEAKTNTDGCITYLKTAMIRRFNGDDPGQIAQLLRRSKESVDQVDNWTKSLEPPQYGDLVPSDILQIVTDFMKSINEQNDRAIGMLADEMERCRLKDWSELTRDASPVGEFIPPPPDLGDGPPIGALPTPPQ